METLTPLTVFRGRSRPFYFSAALLTAGFAINQAWATPEWRMRQVSARTFVRGYTADALAADAPRPAERAFLEKALELSRQHMHFAELGSSQASGSEVRSYAQQILSDHRALGESLDALIRRKGIALRPSVEENTAISESYQRLAERAGADFDRQFVRAMSAQQEDLMTLFEQAAADSKDADIRALAAGQLPTLRAQRNAITELKKALD
jgi:putative membrane protein